MCSFTSLLKISIIKVRSITALIISRQKWRSSNIVKLFIQIYHSRKLLYFWLFSIKEILLRFLLTNRLVIRFKWWVFSSVKLFKQILFTDFRFCFNWIMRILHTLPNVQIYRLQRLLFFYGYIFCWRFWPLFLLDYMINWGFYYLLF